MFQIKKKECPKCKERIDEDNTLVVSQIFMTEVKLTVNPGDGFIEEDTENIASGYNDLEEFINNMLVPQGKAKIIGCETCT